MTTQATKQSKTTADIEADGRGEPMTMKIVEHVSGGVPGGYWALRAEGKRRAFAPSHPAARAIQLRHSDVVVDIGAYVGSFAVACARFPVCGVVAYEPGEEAYRVLQRNALPNAEAIRAAVVADDRPEVEFYVSEGIGVRSSILPSKRKRAVVVSAVSYATATVPATVVKLDVEGAEYGLPIVESITPHLRAIAIEFHHVGVDWEARADRIIAGLEAAGFRPVYPWHRGTFSSEGSWSRDTPDPGGGFSPMLTGAMCCGCGTALPPSREARRTLCTTCWAKWSPRYRDGYARREKTAVKGETTMPTTLLEATLAALDLDQLVREINEEHHAADQAMRDGVDHARRAGQLLLHVKNKLKYGEFMPWVEQHCDFSHRTATMYMRIAGEWDRITENWQSVANLGIAGVDAWLTEAAKIDETHDPAEQVEADQLETLLSSGEDALADFIAALEALRREAVGRIEVSEADVRAALELMKPVLKRYKEIQQRRWRLLGRWPADGGLLKFVAPDERGIA